MVGPRPLTYCSVRSAGTSRIRQPRTRRSMFRATSSCPSMTGISFSWTSMTTRTASARGRRAMALGYRVQLWLAPQEPEYFRRRDARHRLARLLGGRPDVRQHDHVRHGRQARADARFVFVDVQPRAAQLLAL